MAKPPSDRARNAAFAAERARRQKAEAALKRAAARDVQTAMRAAMDNIAALLKKQPSDFQKWRLAQLKKQIAIHLRDAEPALRDAAQKSLALSWDAGRELIDAPLRAGGVDLSAHVVQLDVRKLQAMQAFSTHRISDITTKVMGRIDAHLASSMVGVTSPWEAAQGIAAILETGGVDRALGIVRNNMGAAFSAATQARQEQAAAIVPGMQKQWRRSGKVHSRESHDAIDGQVRDVDQPFDLPNGVQLMHPRDPAGPPGECINCGCTSLPFMASWKVMTPGGRPPTAEEAARNAKKRWLADGLAG